MDGSGKHSCPLFLAVVYLWAWCGVSGSLWSALVVSPSGGYRPHVWPGGAALLHLSRGDAILYFRRLEGHVDASINNWNGSEKPR